MIDGQSVQHGDTTQEINSKPKKREDSEGERKELEKMTKVTT